MRFIVVFLNRNKDVSMNMWLCCCKLIPSPVTLTKQCSLMPNLPVQPETNTFGTVCESFSLFLSQFVQGLLTVRTLRGALLRSLLQVQRNALVCLWSAKTSRSWLETDSQQILSSNAGSP